MSERVLLTLLAASFVAGLTLAYMLRTTIFVGSPRPWYSRGVSEEWIGWAPHTPGREPWNVVDPEMEEPDESQPDEPLEPDDIEPDAPDQPSDFPLSDPIDDRDRGQWSDPACPNI